MDNSAPLEMKDFVLFQGPATLTELFDSLDWSNNALQKTLTDFLPDSTPAYFSEMVAELQWLREQFDLFLKLAVLRKDTTATDREFTLVKFDQAKAAMKALLHDCQYAMTASYFLNRRANRWQDVAIQLAQGKTPDEIFKHLRDPKGCEREEMRKRLTLIK